MQIYLFTGCLYFSEGGGTTFFTMKSFSQYIFLLLIFFISTAQAQYRITGSVFDAQTNEPLAGVNIILAGTSTGASTNLSGEFTLTTKEPVDTLVLSCLGYESTMICCQGKSQVKIALQPVVLNLETMVVTASRTAQARTHTPLAISSLSARQIEETKPTLLTEVLNKVPGVLMVNLGNEQHSMSIRQPMSYRGYFLYLEDGLPIRPAGLFNHNALIEINMFGVNSIEIIKGPASSMYGSEAIGGAVNFITQAPANTPFAKAGLHGDGWGYRRMQFNASTPVTKKLGIALGGYYARQRNGWQDHSDFDKLSLNARADYLLNENNKLITSYTTNNLDTETGGSLDSTGFYGRNYSNLHTFTYRKVQATRARVSWQKFWNTTDETQVTAFYRKNSIAQLPNYAIKNIRTDFSRAHGEINKNTFRSYGLLAQHSKSFSFLTSKILAGIYSDFTPSAYEANYISIDREANTGRYTHFTNQPDSALTNYQVNILNNAAYLQWELMPLPQLRVVTGVRYDRVDYLYDNHLPVSAFSGAPDGGNHFSFITPKIGLTYDLGKGAGIYANVSAGAYAPGVNELYRGVKIPALQPARFSNYEIGGWIALLENKLRAEVSLYQMNGTHEIVSFLLPDNSTENRNSGKTLHRGIEYSLTYTPTQELSIRFGGTNALHKYMVYATTEGTDLDNHSMPNAPAWIANSEISYKPAYIRGLRLMLEWQRIGSWYTDDANQYTYADRTLFNLQGISTLNFRAAYGLKNIELYTNITNLTDELYAHNVTRSRWGATYTPAAGRTFALGIAYTFTGKE